MSEAELKRAAELILTLKSGHIRALKFQPQFELVVEGVLITKYRADFQYETVETRMIEHPDGMTRATEVVRLVVEDLKPKGDFMDDVAKMKIDLFNALNAKHGLKVLISRR